MGAIDASPVGVFSAFVFAQPWLVQLADGLRWITILCGFAIAGIYIRHFRSGRIHGAPGLGWRMHGAALSSLYIAITEFDRLDQPVTLRLPIGVAAMVCLTFGLWRAMAAPSLDEMEREVRLRSLDNSLMALREEARSGRAS